MILLDGKKVSEKRLSQLKEKVGLYIAQHNRRPGLAVIRVGDNPASKIYVAKKIQACANVGILSFENELPSSTSEAEILRQLDQLNQRSDIHGILIQLPLPSHVSEELVLSAIQPSKDVDGFHPINLGRLMAGEKTTVPCTPLGIMNLLREYKIDIKGKRAVVIGRSRIVGRPVSVLLDQAGATVTTIHSQTQNPAEISRQADIVVAAAGKPKLVQKSWIKDGAVVVDVGINRLSDGRIVGDVDFEAISSSCSYITPVPGGVGPMTICSLLENTWDSFIRLSSDE